MAFELLPLPRFLFFLPIPLSQASETVLGDSKLSLEPEILRTDRPESVGYNNVVVVFHVLLLLMLNSSQVSNNIFF